MKPVLKGVLGTLAVQALLLGGGAAYLMWPSGDADGQEVTFASETRSEALPSVSEHTKIFEQRIEEPVEGVHVAIGYGLANVILVDAPEGLILVDTLESIRAATALLPWIDEMRAQTGKVITDVIYTHNHADHAFGAGVFLNGQDSRPRFWAHEGTEPRVNEIVGVLSPITYKRAMRMFGTYLPDGDFENNGIGPRLLSNHRDGFYFAAPSNTLSDRAEVTLAGESVILQHAPGETDDQIVVYLPERKTLLAADNYYHAFPNIYTVRGTPYRDPRKWADSIQTMAEFGAEVMIPQHSQPVIGAAEIANRLTDYRDAIQFTYDETIRLINQGLTPDEIAEVIELPPHLANAPHLAEMYGRVDFAARAVFTGTLGWFSGDPKDLRPVGPDKRADLMAALAGGDDALLSAAQEALDTGEPAWALELASFAARKGLVGANAIKAQSMRALAAAETASSVRNYFLTGAVEAEGFVIPPATIKATPNEMLNGIPIDRFLGILTANVDAVETRDKSLSYGFAFSDAEAKTIRIRRGVAYLEDGLSEDNLGRLNASTDALRALSVGRLDAGSALVSGQISVDGTLPDLVKFLGYFNPPLQQ